MRGTQIDSPGFTQGSDVSSDGASPRLVSHPYHSAHLHDKLSLPLSNELLMAHRFHLTPESGHEITSSAPGPHKQQQQHLQSSSHQIQRTGTGNFALAPTTNMAETGQSDANSSLLSSGVTMQSSSKYEYSACGNMYRVLCFSSIGIKMSILVNLMMIFANTFLIVYELYLIYEHKSFYETKLPFWYILSDLTVTFILLVEIVFNIGAAYNCRCVDYCCSRWDNMMDIIVFLLSAAGCGLYVLDLKQESLDNMDNLLILALRCTRDVIRVIRCIWFFKLLYRTMVRLDIKRHAPSVMSSNLGVVSQHHPEPDLYSNGTGGSGGPYQTRSNHSSPDWRHTGQTGQSAHHKKRWHKILDRSRNTTQSQEQSPQMIIVGKNDVCSEDALESYFEQIGKKRDEQFDDLKKNGRNEMNLMHPGDNDFGSDSTRDRTNRSISLQKASRAADVIEYAKDMKTNENNRIDNRNDWKDQNKTEYDQLNGNDRNDMCYLSMDEAKNRTNMDVNVNMNFNGRDDKYNIGFQGYQGYQSYSTNNENNINNIAYGRDDMVRNAMDWDRTQRQS